MLERDAAKAGPTHAAEPAKPTEPVTPLEPVVVPVPEGLSLHETHVWLLQQEIEATRKQLARRRQLQQVHGEASAQAQLRALLADLRELAPPAPPTGDEEERRWRATADTVLRKIREAAKVKQDAQRERIRVRLAGHPELAAALERDLFGDAEGT
ncbi:MAG TPA: hypothetical protein VK509_10920, partial [Polyangiales bacterium]|nr:hypothetical protein [Polyangiales bacterium]